MLLKADRAHRSISLLVLKTPTTKKVTFSTPAAATAHVTGFPLEKGLGLTIPRDKGLRLATVK